jgi:hypothetical protein
MTSRIGKLAMAFAALALALSSEKMREAGPGWIRHDL